MRKSAGALGARARRSSRGPARRSSTGGTPGSRAGHDCRDPDRCRGSTGAANRRPERRRARRRRHHADRGIRSRTTRTRSGSTSRTGTAASRTGRRCGTGRRRGAAGPADHRSPTSTATTGTTSSSLTTATTGRPSPGHPNSLALSTPRREARRRVGEPAAGVRVQPLRCGRGRQRRRPASTSTSATSARRRRDAAGDPSQRRHRPLHTRVDLLPPEFSDTNDYRYTRSLFVDVNGDGSPDRARGRQHDGRLGGAHQRRHRPFARLFPRRCRRNRSGPARS